MSIVCKTKFLKEMYQGVWGQGHGWERLADFCPFRSGWHRKPSASECYKLEMGPLPLTHTLTHTHTFLGSSSLLLYKNYRMRVPGLPHQTTTNQAALNNIN